MTAMLESSRGVQKSSTTAAHALANAAAEEILCRVGERKDLHIDPVSAEEVKISVTVRFPDNIGSGRVVVHIFDYFGKRRVDITLLHNRMLADRDGNPTSRECYLSDFTASRTLDLQATELPREFTTKVISGIRLALTAVERHNKRIGNGWGGISVAAARS